MINFIKYCFIGILNTGIHWFIFCVLYFLEMDYALCNFIAFSITSVFSFCLNSFFNFNNDLKLKRFIYFYFFMGGIVYLIGFISDYLVFPILSCLIFTSAASLILGFLVSKFLVFKG